MPEHGGIIKLECLLVKSMDEQEISEVASPVDSRG
jgi:inhibitor of KinA sporulation pathway (predicted exonuclease)